MQVLLVDDDPDYRLVLQLALAGDDAFVVAGQAGDGPEAVKLAERVQPDIVLLDCSLPGGDPFDVVTDLRRVAPQARVVLMSGHDVTDLRLASEASGALGWLPKGTPARRINAELSALVDLVEAVQAILDEARTQLDRGMEAPRAARDFVRAALAGWDGGGELDDLADSVTLLVSEVVTNAVVHASSGVEVLVRLTADAAVVEVTDTSEAAPVPRDADDEATSGRGMALVDALARSWGVRPAPGGGKTVWFEVAR
jgi:DNA-binding NarL/FixJ family response regulator